MFGLGHLSIPGAFSCRAWRLCTSSGGGRRTIGFTSSFFSDRLAPPSNPCRGCCQIWDASRCYQGFGEGHGSKLWKRKSWIILRRPTTKSWVSSTKIWGNLRGARSVQSCDPRGVAIPPTRFIRGAQSSLGLNDLAGAIPDLEHVVAADRKFDYYRAAGLLSRCVRADGTAGTRGSAFREVTQISTTRRRCTTTRAS